MYCPKCGSKNEDGSAFCISCGNPLSNINNTTVQNNNSANAYINNLPPIITELKKLDSYEKNINNTFANIKFRKKQIKSFAFSLIFALLGTLFVITPFFYIIIYQHSNGLFDKQISEFVKKEFESTYPDEFELILNFDEIEIHSIKQEIRKKARIYYTTKYTLIIDIFSFVILLFALLIIRKTSNNRNYDMIAKLETDLNNEIEKKNKVMKNLTPVIHILPPNYRYALAADYIYQCFLNSRAYTIQEAVNLYEEQLHRWKMENTQEMMIALQRQQNSDINTMKIFTGITAAASVATALNTR